MKLLRALVASSGCFIVNAGAQERGPDGRAHNPGLTGWCETPIADRKAEPGCYTTASTELGTLPRGPLYWHIDTFPDRASAEANRSSRGPAAEGLGKHWLFTIAEQAWKPRAGERVSVIGPLVVDQDVPYTARYLEAVIKPGFQDGMGKGQPTSRPGGVARACRWAVSRNAQRRHGRDSRPKRAGF